MLTHAEPLACLSLHPLILCLPYSCFSLPRHFLPRASTLLSKAIFDGEVDASTVKHRLDVLNELRLPVFITDFAITNLDPDKV